jgi:hypothetical protein
MPASMLLTPQYKTRRSSPYSAANNRSHTQDLSAFYGTGSSLPALVNTLSWSYWVLPANRGPSSPMLMLPLKVNPPRPAQLILLYFMILTVPVQQKVNQLCSASSTVLQLLPPTSVHTSSDTLKLLRSNTMQFHKKTPRFRCSLLPTFSRERGVPNERQKYLLWLNRTFWDQLTVYYQQMHLMLILFNLKCLKQ